MTQMTPSDKSARFVPCRATLISVHVAIPDEKVERFEEFQRA